MEETHITNTEGLESKDREKELIKSYLKKQRQDIVPCMNKQISQEHLFSSSTSGNYPNLLDLVLSHSFTGQIDFQKEGPDSFCFLQPDVNFKLTRIRNPNCKCRATDLMMRILNKGTPSMQALSYGYFTIDKSLRLLPMDYKDPERLKYPLCGMWAYGIEYEEKLLENSKYLKQVLWGLGVHFISDSRFKPRLSVEKNKCSFVFMLFSKASSPKFFLLEKLNDNEAGPSNFKIKSSLITWDMKTAMTGPDDWLLFDISKEIKQGETVKFQEEEKENIKKQLKSACISDNSAPAKQESFYYPKQSKTRACKYQEHLNLMSRSNPEKQDFKSVQKKSESWANQSPFESPQTKFQAKILERPNSQVPSDSHQFYREKADQRISVRTGSLFGEDSWKKDRTVNSNSVTLIDSSNSRPGKETGLNDREKLLIQHLEKQMELTSQNDIYYKGMIEKMQTQIDMLSKCLFNINSSLSRISDNQSHRDPDQSSFFPDLNAFDIQSTLSYNKNIPHNKHLERNLSSERNKTYNKVMFMKDANFAQSSLNEQPNQKILNTEFAQTRQKVLEENEPLSKFRLNQTIDFMNETGMSFMEGFQRIKESMEPQHGPSEVKDVRRFPRDELQVPANAFGSPNLSESKTSIIKLEKSDYKRKESTNQKLMEIDDKTLSLSEDKSLSLNQQLSMKKKSHDYPDEVNPEKENQYLQIIEENRKTSEQGQGNQNNYSIQVPKISEKYKRMLLDSDSESDD